MVGGVRRLKGWWGLKRGHILAKRKKQWNKRNRKVGLKLLPGGGWWGGQSPNAFDASQSRAA